MLMKLLGNTKMSGGERSSVSAGKLILYNSVSMIVFDHQRGTLRHIWGKDELMRNIPFRVVASPTISC
jgi:hypothetical protein